MTLTTVRFWVYWNGSFTRLSLKPGQSLSFGNCRNHDEGWTAEGERFTHDGLAIIRESFSDGCDCDGRLSSYGEAACPLSELAARDVDGLGCPSWITMAQYQRDHSAEAMGY